MVPIPATSAGYKFKIICAETSPGKFYEGEIGVKEVFYFVK